jgi:predicted ATPase
MLKSITIENFFSFGEAQKIELNSGVNILIGINGSGKSNFIRALRLLSVMSYEGFSRLFLQEWGGFHNVPYFGESENKPIKIIYEFDFSSDSRFSNSAHNIFSYELIIFQNGVSNYYISERFFQEKGNITFLHIINGKVELNTKYQPNLDILRGDESILKQDNSLTRMEDIDAPFSKIKSFLENTKVYDRFDTSEKSPMRRPASTYIEDFLLPDGINLFSLLNEMNINQPLAFDAVENQIREVNPYFKNILSKPIGSKLFYYLKETGLSKSVEFQFISDGTLQYLLLMSIFFNPKRGLLVTLDEPEVYLHPDMINSIGKAIKHAASTGTQMIIATHSPLLLNSFEYEDLIIFEKDDKNQTITSEISDETIEKWASYPVGQMWISGQLGGIRW